MLHDFVVLDMQLVPGLREADSYVWQLPMVAKTLKYIDADAIAFWATETKRLAPLQAAGGLLAIQY